MSRKTQDKAATAASQAGDDAATKTDDKLPDAAAATQAAGAAGETVASAEVGGGAEAAAADSDAGAVGQTAAAVDMTPPPAPPMPDAPPPSPPPAVPDADTSGAIDQAVQQLQRGDGRQEYLVVSVLEHDQESYPVNSKVRLTDKQAGPLLGHTVKAIKAD